MTANHKVLRGGFIGRFDVAVVYLLIISMFSACASYQPDSIGADNGYNDEKEQSDDKSEDKSSDDGDIDNNGENPTSNDDSPAFADLDGLAQAQIIKDSFDNNSDDPCRTAEEELGYLVCRTILANPGDYYQLSQTEKVNPEIERVSKYLIPMQSRSPLPGMIQNVNRFSLHYDFLRTAFPGLYAALTLDQYESLVLNSETRQYFAGALIKLSEKCKGASFAFTVYQKPSEPPLDKIEISYILKSISALMPGKGILYFPSSSAEENALASWEEGTVETEVYNCGTPVSYEAYNTGSAYGYVRILTMSEFEEAATEAAIGWQDIVVLEGVPFSMMSPVAAIITGERQNSLSHINVQASVRGTPNVYVRDGFEVFAAYEGLLVRLDANSGMYELSTDVTADEAQEWWEKHRPKLENVVNPDYFYAAMPKLDEVDVSDRDQRKTAFSRFGGKGANLAILSSVIDHEAMVDGFLVPFRHYLEFMDSNSILLNGNPQDQSVTYSEYVRYWTENEEFRISSAKRREVLGRLTDSMLRSSKLNTKLVVDVAARIKVVFGSENVMVRMRSSSNMEDSVEFSGAGLYESYSACAADSFGGNPTASKCDASKNGQKTIQNALRKVWTSFWKPQAFEERFYFQYFNPDETAMAIAVTPAFGDEAANGVVFTGLPNIPGDRRMLVNAQVGETSVVSPPPGVLPETAILEINSEQRSSVTRIQASSLLSYPAKVLSDAEYSRMASILDEVRSRYPIDAEIHPANSIILDLEFKITQERKLYFKQSRAFLIRAANNSNETEGINFEVKENSVLCGQFIDFREPMEEYALKTMVKLKPQRLELPLETDIDIELVESVSFGPERIELKAMAVPHWERRSFTQNGKTTYQFTYCNTFASQATEARICWQTSAYELAGSFSPSVITINENQISNMRNNWSMTLASDGIEKQIRLSSCTYSTLPTYRRIAVLPSGEKITMDVRHFPTIIGSSNAALVAAVYDDGSAHYSENNYFRLVYAAEHHNLREKLMIVFDRPISGLGGLVFEEPYAESGPAVRLIRLNENLDELSSQYIADYEVLIIP